MRRLVQQAILAQQAIEKELVGLFQQRNVPFNALELRLFTLSLVASFRSTLGKSGVPPILQGEFVEALFEPLHMQSGIVFSPEARTDFGTDLKALIAARYEEYQAKLVSDMRKRRALPAAHQFEGIAVAAAQNVFTQLKDRTERPNLFKNRMQAFLELLEANVLAPASEDE
ncbi:MAG: hypothetical protein JNK11_07120 [Alphaproteobacteria bacterium]|nr:hypothetical protein [Alphaproteobacteria bacterium]